MEWTSKIDVTELEQNAMKNSRFAYSDLTYDELGQETALKTYSQEHGFGAGGQIWDVIKKEFRLFICEKDSKYDDLRAKLDKLSSESTTAIVAVISAGLGAAIGATAAVISPLIAILLIAFIRIGKESFCAFKKLNSKVVVDNQ